MAAGGIDENEAGHDAAFEFHRVAALFFQRLFIDFRIDAAHQIAAEDADAHFIIIHECQATHHGLFFDVREIGEAFADPVG